MTDHTELTREPALSDGDESGIPDDCAADLPSWRKIAPEVWETMTIEEQIRAIFADVPQEVWDEVPDDASYQHDYYIYGGSKRPEPGTPEYDLEGQAAAARNRAPAARTLILGSDGRGVVDELAR